MFSLEKVLSRSNRRCLTSPVETATFLFHSPHLSKVHVAMILAMQKLCALAESSSITPVLPMILTHPAFLSGDTTSPAHSGYPSQLVWHTESNQTAGNFTFQPPNLQNPGLENTIYNHPKTHMGSIYLQLPPSRLPYWSLHHRQPRYWVRCLPARCCNDRDARPLGPQWAATEAPNNREVEWRPAGFRGVFGGCFTWRLDPES